jgi:hypothetical protein
MLTISRLGRRSIKYYNYTADQAKCSATKHQRAGGGLAEYYPESETRVPRWLVADDYIRFQGLPDWQKQLRTEINTRSHELVPSDKQVLHAMFFGAKRHDADIENLVLNNIGPFKVAGSNRIRFEHCPDVPLAPSGREYPFATDSRSRRRWKPSSPGRRDGR